MSNIVVYTGSHVRRNVCDAVCIIILIIIIPPLANSYHLSLARFTLLTTHWHREISALNISLYRTDIRTCVQ